MGPVSEDELLGAFATGDLVLETLVWTPGLKEWRRAADLPELRAKAVLSRVIPPPFAMARSPRSDERPPSMPEAELGARAIPPTVRAKAWNRWFARIVDVFFVQVGLAAVLNAEGIELPYYAIYILSLAGFVLVDAFCVFGWGRTPGKWLLNLRVLSATAEWTPTSSLRRAFDVYVRGMALGIPLVNIFSMAQQHGRLSRGEEATYDVGRARVVALPMSSMRQVLAWVVGLVMLVVVVAARTAK